MKPAFIQTNLEPSTEGIFTNIGNWFGDRSSSKTFATKDVLDTDVLDTYKWLKEAKARIAAMTGVYDKDTWNMNVGKDARMSLVARPSGTGMIDHKMILADQGEAMKAYQITCSELKSLSNRLVAISQTFGSNAPYQRITKQVQEVGKSLETGAFAKLLTTKIYGRDHAYKATEQLVGAMRLTIGSSNGIPVPRLLHMSDPKLEHVIVNTGIRGADKGELITLIDQALESRKTLDELFNLTAKGGSLQQALDKAAELYGKQRENTDQASAHMTREAAAAHFDLCYAIMSCANTAYYEIGSMVRALKIYVLGSERRIR